MSGNTLSTQDRSILLLLAEDVRDHQIAARLFISVRTLHRRLDRLMTRAGAPTRFALGVRATQLGWLPPEALDAGPPGAPDA